MELRKMNRILNFFRKDKIGEPPWKYDFLCSLPESEYPKYLAKIFNYRTGEKLPLSHGVIDKKKLKTFNQKIQWIKLYGVTDLMRKCTDKVAVRDYVKEKIGEEYLKPVLQIIPNETSVIASRNGILDGEAIQPIEKNIQSQLDCRADIIMSLSARNDRELNDVSTYFDRIDFDKLPNSFVIKCNHGYKWQYIIKDKKEFLQNKRLRTFRRVLCLQKGNPKLRFWRGKPDSILGAQTRSNKKSAESEICERVKPGYERAKKGGSANEARSCPRDSKFQDTFKGVNDTMDTFESESKDFNGGNSKIFEIVKRQITGWLEQEYWCWGGFEMQYREIKPKILIEPLMRDNIDISCQEIQVYCFNGSPKYIIKLHNDNEITIWNENLKITYDPFGFKEKKIPVDTDNYINKINMNNEIKSKENDLEEKQQIRTKISIKKFLKLSSELSKDFIFVRVDWMLYKNKPYFEELTFTPYSGFNKLKNKKYNLQLGSWIDLERNKNGF